MHPYVAVELGETYAKRGATVRATTYMYTFEILLKGIHSRLV